MHELVRQHVLEVRVGAGERQDDPVLERLRDAPGALVEEDRERVRLLEVRVRGVQDDGLAFPELVLEHPGESRVGPLHHARRIQRRLALLLVEVDVEVRGLDDLEVEGPVLDLVPPEVLGRCRARTDQQRRGRGHECQAKEQFLPPGRACRSLAVRSRRRPVVRVRGGWAAFTCSGKRCYNAREV